MKISKIQIFFFLLILSGHLNAANPICDDLAKFACAPGEYDDGTGVGRSPYYVDSAPILAEFTAAGESAKKKFAFIISNPKNSYFRKLAISALGLSGSPYCNSGDKQMLEKCNSDLLTGLGKMAQADLSGTGEKPPSGASNVSQLSEKYMLSQQHLYIDVIAKIDAEFTKKIVDPKRAERVEKKIFPEVKRALIDRIKSLSIDEEKKKFMITKIGAITFSGTNCVENTHNLGRHFIPNAMYDPIQNDFKVCNGMLINSTSEFQLATVIAHELAHAIGPCQLSIGPDTDVVKYSTDTNLETMEREYPMSGLISCLRSNTSVGAVNQAESTGRSSTGQSMAGAYSAYPTSAGVSNSPKYNFCEGDQIGEAVSDWFAGEVTSAYISKNFPQLNQTQWQLGASNMFRGICSSSGEKKNAVGVAGFNVHPESDDRINAIFLSQKDIRAKMGCPDESKKYKYCSPDKVGVEYYVSRLKPESHYLPGMGGFGTPTNVPTQSPSTPAGGTTR